MPPDPQRNARLHAKINFPISGKHGFFFYFWLTPCINMTFNVCQSFYSNICELSPWWLVQSVCLSGSRQNNIWRLSLYILFNESVPVPAELFSRFGSCRNFKNWFWCTPNEKCPNVNLPPIACPHVVPASLHFDLLQYCWQLPDVILKRLLWDLERAWE
jgi:hypothetical protein